MKQLIMTLVALIAVTTGAWAQGKLIYEKDFSSDAFYPFYLDAADQTGASATVTDGLLVLTNPKVQATNWDVQPEIGRLTSAAPTTQGNTYRVVMQYKTTVAGSVTFALGAQDWSNADWSGQTITVSNDFQTCEAYFNNYPYSNSESHILLQFGELVGTITIKKVEVYELYPFPITWDTTTKTATIAEMPASNVIVTPEYYPQATLATAPTAADGAKATTDDLLVSGGTVATITGSDPAAPQGTLMYYVSTSTMTTEALLALDADKWVTEPTAAGITQKCGAFVYYYVKGNDSTDDALNFSDGDISSANVLNVPIYPAPLWNAEFDLTNAPEEDKAGKWSTDIPEGGVVKGTPVTVTYTGTRKVIGVKAEKKGAAGKPVSEITPDDIFKVIASDGIIYDNIAAAESAGTVAQGLIVYVGSNTGNENYNHGLALALNDENSNTQGGAINACNAKNTSTPIVDALWMLPSQGQYNTMFNAAGGDWKLRDCFSSAGGINMVKDGTYWSSTGDSEWAKYHTFSGNDWEGIWSEIQPYYNNSYHVRACIVF